MNPNNTNPGAEVTGNDDLDLQREIEAILAQSNGNNAGTQPTQPVSTEIETEIGGQKIKFANSAELGSKIGQILQQYQALNAENSTLKAQIQPKKDEKATPAGFSNDTWAELIQKGDVLGALDYANNHLYFNGQQPQASKALAAMVQQSQQTAIDLAVLRFKDAHPELPRTPETAAVLDQIRSQYNFPFTADGLESAYAMAKHRGLITPTTPQQEQRHQPQSTNPSLTKHFQSPVLGRQSGADPTQLYASQLEQAANMSTEQLYALAQRLAAQGIN